MWITTSRSDGALTARVHTREDRTIRVRPPADS